MTTAPFDPQVAQVITQSHEQGLRAEVVTASGVLDLDVTDWSIDWDETRSPRVQGSVVVPVPDTQAELDTIDPRTMVRVRLHVSYRLPDGTLDEQQVADLGLRSRRVTRSGDGPAALTLNVVSDEALVIDGGLANPTAGDATWTSDTLHIGIMTLINQILAGTPAAAPAWVRTIPDIGPITWPQSPHPWDAINDQADQYDVNVFDDGDRMFRIEPRAVVAGSSVLTLTVGSNGTVLQSDTGVSRDDWANGVTVAYRWTDTATNQDVVVSGYIEVSGGPFAPAASGYKLLADYRNMPGTTAGGSRAASTLLRRMLARSRSFTITAVPAWWVRPGRTVTIQLPLGGQERHLVSRVAFRPGAMTIETRLPDTASTYGE